MSIITPCLWFDDQGEAAAEFYVKVFIEGGKTESGIDSIMRYPEVGHEVHGKSAGSVMQVEFHLDGQAFTALNGGPQFKFSEAISLQVFCQGQAEIDYFWQALLADGGEQSMCGWLKDKYGLSWQVFDPQGMGQYLGGPDKAGRERAMAAMFEMHKIELEQLRAAYEGA